MTLKTHPMLIIALGVIPCSVEMVIMSLCCKGILLFPWNWAAMTGSILSGMSPVVAINNILGLAEKGYGEDKGLATMICTAACIDNVHIVPIFVICYSIVFANDKGKGKMWVYIPAGLRDFILGILTGLVLGILFTFFPHRGHVSIYSLGWSEK
ncbi:sodium/hydrogen exchanger 9B1-like [Hylaeus anthracinus]|uniref:sodium/hydrogen exchanger 9B1-like n=1 Tax=Hylaeus anthracinus TaxID=313031 RepID=UPI0023B8FC51|nr:sodium/hydrogen exchanger 9B1-like [Hylaeus anthracinus]